MLGRHVSEVSLVTRTYLPEPATGAWGGWNAIKLGLLWHWMVVVLLPRSRRRRSQTVHDVAHGHTASVCLSQSFVSFNQPLYGRPLVVCG